MINQMKLRKITFLITSFQIYQLGLETSVIGSNFVFDCVQLLYFKCHKTSPNHGGSYIDLPDWIKKTKKQ